MANNAVSYGSLKSRFEIIIAVALLFMSSSSVWAHRVNVYAYSESDRIVVEGYFGGKVKAVGCVVEVLGADGKKLVEGKTDDSGVCAFPLVTLAGYQGDLRIILHAGAGHQAEFKLVASEHAGENRISRPASEPNAETKENLKDLNRSATKPVMDNAALTKVLEETLDRKIRPLLEMVSNQQRLLLEQKNKGPSLIEIIGGLGWIFGIFGVAAYFMSRRRGDRDSR